MTPTATNPVMTPTATNPVMTPTPTPPQSVYISGNSYGSTTSACAGSTDTQVFYVGTLGDGTTLYENSGLNPAFSGDNDWYKIGSSNTARINGSGVISQYQACPSNSVTGVFASTYDELGEIFVSATVSLSEAVSSDVQFEVDAELDGYGTVRVSVVIFTGNNNGTGTQSIGMGSPYNVSSQCIFSCDNPSISLGSFAC
jgi:hypothetical protein